MKELAASHHIQSFFQSGTEENRMSNFQAKPSSKQKPRRGTVLILVAVCLVVLMTVAALSLDGGRMFDERRQVQAASDSAADAGAQELYESSSDGISPTEKAQAVQKALAIAEANGYANHIATNPLPRTPNHTVLMEIAIGDFQVSDWAALVEARTIGAKLLCPATTAQRFPGIAPLWGVPCAKTSPFHDSGIVLWDSGTPAPPITNSAPSVGVDSHEDPRASSANRDQKSQFFGDDPTLGSDSNGYVRGAVVDVCNAQPCTAPSVG